MNSTSISGRRSALTSTAELDDGYKCTLKVLESACVRNRLAESVDIPAVILTVHT